MPCRVPPALRTLTASHRAFSTSRALAEGPGIRRPMFGPAQPSSTRFPAAVQRSNWRYERMAQADPATRERASEIMSMLITPAATSSSSPIATGTGSPTEEFTQQELLTSQQRFVPGDIYAPNDLTMEEFTARRSNRKPVRDAFDLLGINPLTQYKNYNLLSEYVTSMGRILHSKDTGLRPVNQRRMAKAIRRAVGIGFLPSVHRHPEVLKSQENMMTGRMGRIGGPFRR